WPLGLLYRLWAASIRIESVDLSDVGKESASERPCVLMLWHNRLFIAGEWHRRFRKDMTCYGLISASKDGALLETFYGWAGIRAVRGSRNRRGTQAVRELVRVMREGHDVGVTPDGSRGPRYEAKSGALLVARLAKAPILFLSFEFSWAAKLNSWDKFVVPFPFSKVIATHKFLCFEDIFEGRNLEEATEFAQLLLAGMTKD
ncbi:MAG: lysophospholipid acyltransferase family protein, partial [Opitutae bacterium]